MLIAFGIAGVVVGDANFTMPLPDPPPPDDSFWGQEHSRDRWFAIGCCGGLPTGCVGLMLLSTCFPLKNSIGSKTR